MARGKMSVEFHSGVKTTAALYPLSPCLPLTASSKAGGREGRGGGPQRVQRARVRGEDRGARRRCRALTVCHRLRGSLLIYSLPCTSSRFYHPPNSPSPMDPALLPASTLGSMCFSNSALHTP